MTENQSEAIPEYNFRTNFPKINRKKYSIFRVQVMFDIKEEINKKFFNSSTKSYDKNSLIKQWNENRELYSINLSGKPLTVTKENKNLCELDGRTIDNFIEYTENNNQLLETPKLLEGFCRLILNKTYSEWLEEHLKKEAEKIKQGRNLREKFLGLRDIFLKDLAYPVIEELQKENPKHLFISADLFVIIIGDYKSQMIEALEKGVSFSFLSSTFIGEEDEKKYIFLADAVSFNKENLFKDLRDSVMLIIQLMDSAIKNKKENKKTVGNIRAKFTSDLLLNRIAIFEKDNDNCSCLFAPYINTINTVNSPMYRWDSVNGGFIDTIVPVYEKIWNADNTYSFIDYVEANKDELNLSALTLAAFERIKENSKSDNENSKKLFLRQS